MLEFTTSYHISSIRRHSYSFLHHTILCIRYPRAAILAPHPSAYNSVRPLYMYCAQLRSLIGGVTTTHPQCHTHSATHTSAQQTTIQHTHSATPTVPHIQCISRLQHTHGTTPTVPHPQCHTHGATPTVPHTYQQSVQHCSVGVDQLRVGVAYANCLVQLEGRRGGTLSQHKNYHTMSVHAAVPYQWPGMSCPEPAGTE